MTIINFFKPDHEPDLPLLYSIIAARHEGKWIFVRHRGKKTWEIPAGHIEAGESPYDAAVRELAEETGAYDFRMDCVATYSVTSGEYTGYGRLFLASVILLGDIIDKSEIAEIMFSESLPAEATYPEIQPVLLKRCIEYLGENGV